MSCKVTFLSLSLQWPPSSLFEGPFQSQNNMSGRLAAFVKRATLSNRLKSPFAPRTTSSNALKERKPTSLAKSVLETNKVPVFDSARVTDSIKQSYAQSKALFNTKVEGLRSIGYVFQRFACIRLASVRYRPVSESF